MTKKEIWVQVSELMEGRYGFSIRVGRVNKKKTWILENNRQQAVAHQIFEPDTPPFQNVHCLLEMSPDSEDENSTVDVVAFWIKANQ
ncbi:hypothetical protein [Runella sp.]|uniref:hypothetical protein n=1 Tax=Runella sp. TaxID=1960881 RepID=UPI003D146295